MSSTARAAVMSRRMFLLGILFACASHGVLIQCPPHSSTQNSLTDLAPGHSCGGFCGAKGSCAAGLTCQKPCQAVAHPSASFAIIEMGAPEPDGVCVDGSPRDGEVAMPGAPMQKGVCDASVVAAANAVMKVIDAQSNSLMSMQLVQVLSASSQVVAGIRWQLTILAGPSTCPKPADGSFVASCDGGSVPDDGRDVYVATAYHAAWKKKPWHVASWKITSRSWRSVGGAGGRNARSTGHGNMRKRRKVLSKGTSP